MLRRIKTFLADLLLQKWQFVGEIWTAILFGELTKFERLKAAPQDMILFEFNRQVEAFQSFFWKDSNPPHAVKIVVILYLSSAVFFKVPNCINVNMMQESDFHLALWGMLNASLLGLCDIKA